LQEPVLGLRLRADVKLDPLPEDVLVMCEQTIADKTWTGRQWIFGEAKDASVVYYLANGYFKRLHPDPGEHLYYQPDQGGLYEVKGVECRGDPAREVFDVRDFKQIPQAVLQQLARDLAARLVRALGGEDRLRAEIKNQRIDFDQLSPELQEAFAPYFGK